jgi:hypothetical protein
MGEDMRTESEGPNNSEDAGHNPTSTEKAVGDQRDSDSAHMLEALKKRFRSVRGWAARHRCEIFFAFIAAVPLAWLGAVWFVPPNPYKVVLLTFDSKYRCHDPDADPPCEVKWPGRDHLTIGRYPVVLQILRLGDEKDDNKKRRQIAVSKAKDLVRSPDTLMVIGDLESTPTQASLAVYLEADPPLPYVSTTASGDNLLPPDCPRCSDENKVAAFLQTSPTNKDEADSAYRYAKQVLQKDPLTFFVVTEDAINDATNDQYSSNLYNDFINRLSSADAHFEYTLESLSEHIQDLQTWKPDCVFYIGTAGTATKLMKILAGRVRLVILSDEIVTQASGMGELESFPSAVFTYAADAADYNESNHVYQEDAIEIAGQLVSDLQTRGGDVWYQIRSLTHSESVESARQNLVQVIKDNSANNKAYDHCASAVDNVCVFARVPTNPIQRQNGLFHVWKVDSYDKSKMRDIDEWHRPRDLIEVKSRGEARHRDRKPARSAVEVSQRLAPVEP